MGQIPWRGTGWFAAPNAIFGGDFTMYERLLFLYLCRRAGPDGASWPAITTIVEDTGMSRSTVLRALKGLQEKGLLEVLKRNDEETGASLSNVYCFSAQCMAIMTSMSEGNKPGVTQTPGGVTQTPGGFTQTPPGVSVRHRGGVCETPKGLPIEGLPTEGQILSMSLPAGSDEKIDKPVKKKFTNDSTEYRLASLLRDQMLIRNPYAKVPKDLQAWARSADLLLRLDKRDARQAAQVIQWAVRDPFWGSVVRSMDKVRKHYDTLVEKMQGLTTSRQEDTSMDEGILEGIRAAARARGIADDL